jgi:peptidoglycan/xylan/chitin deacetylase (PgdA/CDA1 family)
MYHHVFDDERIGFDNHLRYMRRFGEFASLDQCVEMLETEHVDGRYFCITIDDGFRNCVTNAISILKEHGCIATVFVPSGFVAGTAVGHEGIRYFDWEDCRTWLEAGMTLGSHTCNHVKLAMLSSADAERELRESKRTFEEHLQYECAHFAAPWGRAGEDYVLGVHDRLTRELGYRSFSTCTRGINRCRADCFKLKRDHLIAGVGTYSLRYFFSANL